MLVREYKERGGEEEESTLLVALVNQTGSGRTFEISECVKTLF